jgi:hypothetical protein
MKGAFGVALAVLSGCTVPQFHDGALLCASGTNECPEGFRCVDGRCWQAFVQSAGVASASASVALPFKSSNTAGNCIVVAISNGTGSVTDSNGNSYHKVLEYQMGQIWYAPDIAAGPNTIQLQAGAGFSSLEISEYSGIDLIAPQDVSSMRMGYGTALDSGAITTHFPQELLFALADGSYVSTAGSGFTLRNVAGGNAIADRVVTSVGTYSATFAQDPAKTWTASIVAFKVAAK